MMTSVQILTLIVMWCGQPMNKTIAGDSAYLVNGNPRVTTEGYEVAPASVRQCRLTILKCIGDELKMKPECFK